MEYKILNSKEIKIFQESVEKQFGAKFSSDYVFLKSNEKIFICNRELFDIDLSKFRVNSLGIYIAEVKDNTLRLSVEGSQLIGPNATKNVFEITDAQLIDWLKGNDLATDKEFSGFVIIKHNNDFFACGKYTKEGKILNYLPKTRRISSPNIS